MPEQNFTSAGMSRFIIDPLQNFGSSRFIHSNRFGHLILLSVTVTIKNGKAEKEKRNGFRRAIRYDSPQFLPIMKEIYEWSHIFSKVLVVFADKME